MGMFVEELKFSQLTAGDFIEFLNKISGNPESGTVINGSPKLVMIEQWDTDMGGDVCNTYGPNDISDIVKIK